ncbi:MAG: dephospho-CoA kinase [Muribaculaceae bacterium]|nr:dephospho-CoA kinase [Muribaculaceae bacterium]
MTPKLIAVCGGIGAGKSTVTRLLRIMGYPVYDCDSQAKRLMEESEPVKQQLIDLFGPTAYDGNHLNRQLIASQVFNDKSLLNKLNSIVHPAVKSDIIHWAHNNQGDELLFVETAILKESNLEQLFDNIIYVTAPIDIRIRRVMKRSNLTHSQVMERINNQDSTIPQNAAIIINDDTNSIIAQTLQILSGNTDKHSHSI